jgi:hypothetical protein
MGQNRCSGCNHFAGLEAQDPDIESYDFDIDALTVKVDVRISLATECCSVEAKEHTFNFDETPSNPAADGAPLTEDDIEAHRGDGHEITIEDIEAENESRVQPGRVPRYSKQFYGVKVTGRLECSCGETILESFELTGDIEASAMEATG